MPLFAAQVGLVGIPSGIIVGGFEEIMMLLKQKQQTEGEGEGESEELRVELGMQRWVLFADAVWTPQACNTHACVLMCKAVCHDSCGESYGYDLPMQAQSLFTSCRFSCCWSPRKNEFRMKK